MPITSTPLRWVERRFWRIFRRYAKKTILARASCRGSLYLSSSIGVASSSKHHGSVADASATKLLTPFVNEVPDAETAERDAFAQFADIGHGLGGRHCLGGHSGWFPLGEAFQGAGYYLLGRVVTTGAEMRRDELLAVRVEGQGRSEERRVGKERRSRGSAD